MVGSELLIGYGLARLLMRRFPGRQIFRTIHTVPLLVALIAVGAAWRVLLVPGLGPLPHYLERWFGWHIDIGTSDRTAFAALVIVDIWHWTPFVTLCLLAGLSALPVEPFEAARVDGASAPKTFWYITVPMLKPVLIAVTFIRLMDAMRLVDEAVMLTKEDPAMRPGSSACSSSASCSRTTTTATAARVAVARCTSPWSSAGRSTR